MEYTEDNLTEWFDIKNQKPWEPGVYLVLMEYGVTRYSFFDGAQFNYVVSQETPNATFHAFNMRNQEGAGSVVSKWCGINFNPQAPQNPAKKKGNKRKTLYVVFESNYAKTKKVCVGCYSVKKNAQIKSESVPYGFIQEVRFRTPEA